jgi:hypothetical protein
LHIPDAGLRLEPGETVTVAALSPQLVQLSALGLVAITAPSPTPAPLPPAVPPALPPAPPPSRTGHRNAAEVLPPRLLARVQRVITGYVTIPPPVTAADARRQQVIALQRQGATPREIAAALPMSRRQVSRLRRALAAAAAPSAPAHPLPAPLLAQVQRYVTGRLYVPAMTSAARRRSRLHQAFMVGEATVEIARRERCSARQVRRERARWRDTQACAGEEQTRDGRSTDRQPSR